MTFPSGGSQDEIVRWILEIEAKAALESLRQVNREAQAISVQGISKADIALKAFANNVARLSKEQKRNWQDVLRELIAVDAKLKSMQNRTATGQFASGKTGSVFTGIDPRAIQSIIQADIAMGKYKVNQEGVIGATDKATQSSHKFGRSLDAVRIAMGAIVAMVVFRTIQFIEESMRKAITTATEFEQSLYRLSNVEKILSQQGTEISFAGLKKGIEEIKELLPIFSETDITQQVSLIGIMTKELGYTEQQILDLAKAIGVLNIRSPEPESLTETTQKILTALVAPTGKGISTLGIPLGEDAIVAEALAEHLLKAGEGISDLTKQEKDLVKLNIVLKNAGKELINIDEYLKSNAARLDENRAAWEDLLKTVGEGLVPLVPALTGVFEDLEKVAVTAKQLAILTGASIAGFFAFYKKSIGVIVSDLGLLRKAMLSIFTGEDANALLEQIRKNGIDAVNEFVTAYEKSFSELTYKFFPELREQVETTTGDIGGLGDAITELPGFDDLAKDLEKLGEKIEETAEKFKKEWAGADIDLDLAINIDQTGAEFDALGREVQDFVIDIQRMVEDYAIKRRRIIEDANNRIADANQRHHNQEIDAEARFQEQLRQLREKFLFNLEDALRERDARQVLRLQRQYEMDKTALTNEFELRQQEADRQHQEDLARIRRERDDRLAELAEEERIKLQREQEDFQLKQERAKEDHEREMAELAQQIDDRLREYVDAHAEELELNEEAADALYNLLKDYYGVGGKFDELYGYSYESLVAAAQAMLAQVNAIVQQARNTINSVGSGPAPEDYYLRHAEETGGGSATTSGGRTGGRTPTRGGGHRSSADMAFGDSLSSMALPRKLGSVGVPAGASVGGSNGRVDIELWLSPDLEARIVDTTLNETAGVFAKVNRSK